MKKVLMMAAVCIMAWAAFADKNDAAKDADTNAVPIILNVGSLRPGGNTPVFKVSDFNEMEKIDFTDITNIKLGTTLADMGEYDFSKATSELCDLDIPRGWSDGGKSEALRVTSLLVDRKTREIKGAISDAYFQSIGEGVFAITNDVFGAVRAKKDARYLKPEIDMKHGKGRCVYFWPSADGKVVFELLTQFVMSKQGQMSVNTLLHVYGDQINTKPMCQK